MDSPYRGGAAAADYAATKDERDGCRSLICDANGIIIAEMVYRCMICSSVLDSIGDAKLHYHKNHISDDDHNGNTSDDPIMYPDNELSMDVASDDDEPRASSGRGRDRDSAAMNYSNMSDADFAYALDATARHMGGAGRRPKSKPSQSPDKYNASNGE